MSESLWTIIGEGLESVKPILYSVGIGGIGGFFVGYLVKKILNLAIIFGVVAFGFLYLGQMKVINPNFQEIMSLISNLGDFFSQSIGPLMATVPFMSSFFLGFFGGLRQG